MPANSLLQVYTINGEKVIEEKDQSGVIEWSARNKNNKIVSEGVYIYVLKDSNGQKKTGKIAITR